MAQLTAQKWFCDSSTYSSVAAWTALTIYAAGALVRQAATPAVGSERVFVCIIAGTSLASEPSWTITQGAKTAEAAGPTWMECTGKAGVNGDLSDTVNWNTVKNTAVSLGVLIQRISGGSLQICTTAGTCGNGAEPSFSNTAGTTTTDNAAVWTSLGAPGNFAALAAPWARLSLAFASSPFAGVGDLVYYSKNHAETQSSAAMSYTALASGVVVLGIDPAGGVNPPATPATGGSITTTGTNAVSLANGTSSNFGKIVGLTVNCSDGSGQADLTIDNAGTLFTENCTFNLKNTNTASRLRMNGVAANNYSNYHVNPAFTFGATGQSMTLPQGKTIIKGGSTALTGSVPSIVFAGSGNAGAGGLFRVMDHDYSACSGTIIDASNSTPVYASFENCKLNGTAATAFPNASVAHGCIIRCHNSDSTNTNYNYLYKSLNGSAVSDIAITRNGGAALAGQALAWHLASTAACVFSFPFETEELGQLNLATGSAKTVTVYLQSDTALTNANCWAEVEALQNASFPLGSIVSSRAAYLATPVALTTDTSVWTGTAKAHQYKIVLTMTPQMAGAFKVRVFVGGASLDVWVDPLAVLA